uniref:Uncharacterized protein n=1 Tax=Anguilla anguilla TaxID=7936 RepID=A0A0E9WTN9_ANGAN
MSKWPFYTAGVPKLGGVTGGVGVGRELQKAEITHSPLTFTWSEAAVKGTIPVHSY